MGTFLGDLLAQATATAAPPATLATPTAAAEQAGSPAAGEAGGKRLKARRLAGGWLARYDAVRAARLVAYAGEAQ